MRQPCSRTGAALALAVALTVACRARRDASPATSCAAPRVDTRGWTADSGSAFRLRLPPGLRRQAVEGIDSEVGRWAGVSGAVSYDYGSYSNDLSDVPAREAQPCETTIGGRRARIVTYRLPDGGYAAAAHWPSDGAGVGAGQRGLLTMTAAAPDSSGRRAMLAVLHSVRFKDR